MDSIKAGLLSLLHLGLIKNVKVMVFAGRLSTFSKGWANGREGKDQEESQG
jgi:hypothetical protein